MTMYAKIFRTNTIIMGITTMRFKYQYYNLFTNNLIINTIYEHVFRISLLIHIKTPDAH